MKTILMAIAIAVTPPNGEVSQKRIERAQRNAPHIAAAALEHDIPPLLLVAIIHKESSFRRRVRGLRGEIGLMQLLRTGGCIPERLPTRKAIVPRTNIMLGAKCLARYIKRCGSISAGLSRYNGRGCTTKTEYSDKVTRRWKELELWVSLVARASPLEAAGTPDLHTADADNSSTAVLSSR